MKGTSPEQETSDELKNESRDTRKHDATSEDDAFCAKGSSKPKPEVKIVKPSSSDVLFGRGKPFQTHSGNIRLHTIVNLHKGRYMNSRRYDKLAIAEQIVREIKSDKHGEPAAGRFLKRSDGEEYWIEVSDDVAREKVSHALRGKKPKKEADNKRKLDKPAPPGPHFGMDALKGSPVQYMDQYSAPQQKRQRISIPIQHLPPFPSRLHPFVQMGQHRAMAAMRATNTYASSTRGQDIAATNMVLAERSFTPSTKSTLASQTDLARLLAPGFLNQQQVGLISVTLAANPGLLSFGSLQRSNSSSSNTMMPNEHLNLTQQGSESAALARIYAREHAIARILQNSSAIDENLMGGQRFNPNF